MKFGKMICSILVVILFVFGLGIKLVASILKAIAMMLKIVI